MSHLLGVIYFLCLGLAATVVSQGTTDNPVVDLGYAKYRGIRNTTDATDTYYGIRYAAAPVGNLRWQAPAPIETNSNYSSSEIIDATSVGPQCVQGTTAWLNGTSISLIASLVGADSGLNNSEEDCLLLNVLTPTSPKSAALPVLVYIHGGGFITGSSVSTDPTEFMRYSQGNIVWVSIQYRLGAYGFLSTEEFAGGNGQPNAGLLDQRLALGWVQRHIKSFGGDPSKVTIWGGSAGGSSVADQLILYGGERQAPFRGAIAEYPWLQPYHDSNVLEKQFQNLLNVSHCDNLECLRKLSESDLEAASTESYATAYDAGLYSYGDYYYGPSVDGKIIQDLPSVEFTRGHFSKVPFMTDHDAFEGILFTNMSITNFAESEADLVRSWTSATPSFWNSLSELYPLSDFTGSYFSDPFFTSLVYIVLGLLNPLILPNFDPSVWQLQSINGDAYINCPTYYFASAFAEHGIPAWKFIYDADPYVHAATSVIFFVDQPPPVSEEVATAVKDYFLSFIIDLNPNTFPSVSNQSRIEWPNYSRADYGILKVQDATIYPDQDPDASARCSFLNSQGSVVRS